MVNMAGGVMENAGLCLDRFGLPYIPGSAVKGCARRAALAALHEWCETGLKPGAAEADKDNLFQTACEPFTTTAHMLAAIARVFGWGEQDWKTRAEVLKGVTPKRDENDGQFQQRCQKLWEERCSDLAWACGDHWEATRAETLALLGSAPANEQGARAPRRKDFAGSVSFLPAHLIDLGKTGPVDGLPVPVPELGKLELDVVTCHHPDYYGEKTDAEGSLKMPVARDVEDPNPVVFPAVAPGHVFTFALIPLRSADAKLVELLEYARAWLTTGLGSIGLGAKTNAGYGWFQDVTDPMRKAQEEARERQAQKDRQAKEKADIEAARNTLQPDPALLERLRAMKEPDLRGQINPFATEERFWIEKNEQVQLTLLHFLAVTEPGLLAADRANPKSKIAKAIANLAAKFPHLVAAQKP